MAGLWKKYNEQGLHIIGLESQGSTAAAINTMAKANGLGYQLTVGGNIKGANVSGLPHTFLFAADGSLAAENPKPLEPKIKQLLSEAAGAMAGPGPYVKLAPLAVQIKAGQNLGAILKTLAVKKDSKDAAEQAEAVMMYDALHGAAQTQLDSALAKKDHEIPAALAKLDKIAQQFIGDEIGAKAKTEADTLRRDPKTRSEVDAEAMYKQIEAMVDKLKPVRGAKDYKDEAFRKPNMAAIQGIVGGCQSLTQRYPGTGAAAKAESLMNDFK